MNRIIGKHGGQNVRIVWSAGEPIVKWGRTHFRPESEVTGPDIITNWSYPPSSPVSEIATSNDPLNDWLLVTWR
jgi:hypothetical protein